MEFLRFGSSIPGTYWGCCAVCIIQNFNFDPDQKSSIQMVDGDGGNPIVRNGGDVFAGPTYRDIFWQRLRCGTFSTRDMPNHVFLAVLTEYQITHNPGKKWLTLLKEAGFEFIRTTDNSVYTGEYTKENNPSQSPHKNYLFGLFRNIGAGAVDDPFTPPKAWTDLPEVIPEAWQAMGAERTEVVKDQQQAHRAIWDKMGKPTFLSRAEVEEAGAPVILAGLRSQYPQQKASARPSDAVAGDGDPFADDDYEEDYEDECEVNPCAEQIL